MNRSHSRHSHPFDKRVPKMERKYKVTFESGSSMYFGYGSVQRQIEKKMYKKKQREHNRKLCTI